MRTPRMLAGRKAKVALMLAAVAIACTAATCASTETRGRQTVTPTILSAPNPATALAATGPDGNSTAEAVPRGTFSISGGLARPMAPGSNQDACKDTTFELTYAGTVTR